MIESEGVRSSAEAPVPSSARLALLIVEGYFYLAVIIGVFVGSVAFLAWGVLNRRPLITLSAIFVGIPLTVTTARAIYTLFFMVTRPDGVEITRRRGARLRAMVDDVRTRIGAPRIHRILLTGEFNASAFQVPRLAIFWPCNTLLLGYPLLATLSVDQLRAVIAHELGHITHAHGRLASWVYRTRITWLRLMRELRAREATPVHALWLFRWYVPRLQAESAGISRQQEFLADRLAAEVARPEVTAQALVAIEAGAAVLNETFWPEIERRVEQDPEPPPPYSLMRPEIWDSIGPADRRQLLDRLLEGESHRWDTHPPLSERLARIKRRPQLPAPVHLSAADELLGEEKESIVAVLDEEWRAARRQDWHDEYERRRNQRTRLAELDALASPSPAETFEHATLCEHAGDRDRALALYRSASAEGHAEARVAAGRILLERHDERGIEMIDTAIEANPSLVQLGCDAVAAFFEQRGRHVDAHRYRVRQARAATHARIAATERGALTVVDRFVPAADPPIDSLQIRRCLAVEPAIIRAFLVGKELRHSRGTQTVLALVTTAPLSAEVLDRLRHDCRVSPDTTLATLTRHDQTIEAMLAAIPGAHVYERDT